MAQYIHPADLASLGAGAGILSSFDNAAQNKACLAASAKADGYLRMRFMLPLISWGDDLKQALAAIAIYDLLSLRGFNPESGADTNIRDRHNDAMKWLRGIADGGILPTVEDSRAKDPTHSLLASSPWMGCVIGRHRTPRGW